MTKSTLYERDIRERLPVVCISLAVFILAARIGHAKCPLPVPTYEALVAAMESDSMDQFNAMSQCIRIYGDPVAVLVQAAENNNEKLFASMVLLPNDVNSAMTAAVRRGAAAAIEFLARHGADVDARDKKGNTLLMRACDCEKFKDAADMVSVLLKSGANPNLKNYDKEDALDLVAEHCPRKVRRTLKYYGARGGTNAALFKAAISGDVEEIFEALLSGANANLKRNTQDWGKVSALRLAVSNKHIEAVRMILAFGADFDPSALIAAVKDGSTDIARLLIETGPNLKTVNWGNDLPLHLALSKEYDDIAKYLIDAGVDVNSPGKSQKTPLHLAVERESEAAVEMLINAGAIIDAEDNNSETSFSIAAKKKNDKLVRRLYGACNVANCSQDGKAPLHSAIQNRQYEAAKILIKLGYNISIVNRQGKTPLHLAVENENDEIAIILIQSGAKINVGDAENKTPLHVAAEKENYALVKLLVDAGAQNTAAHGGTTPLHIALRNKDWRIAEMLLDIARPEDIDREDAQGYTTLHLAVGAASDEEGISIVREILKRTQDPNVLTHSGKNALTYARNDKVRKLLSAHGIVDLEVAAAEAERKAEKEKRRAQRREKIGDVLPYVFAAAAGVGYLTGGFVLQLKHYDNHPEDNPFSYVNYFSLEAMLSAPGICLLGMLENAQYLAPIILGLAMIAFIPTVVYGIVGWKNLDSEGSYYASTVLASIAIPICISIPFAI